MGRAALQSWGKETMTPSPTPMSFRPERSKAEWSGEISSPNGTGPIAVGDLSTQSINGVQMPLSSYRHAAPLEMTCWRAAHSHGEQKQMTQIPHPPTCHFDRNGAKQSGVEWSGEISGLNGTSASPLPLSFRPERSKAEWSGEISGPNGTGPIAVGDLGAQSLNGVQIP